MVLLGYLFVLSGTMAGQGWRLLAHEAHSHAVPMMPAPRVHADTPPPDGPAMMTLRSEARQGHGAHAHDHKRHVPGTIRPGAMTIVRVGTEEPKALEDDLHHLGLHDHGGEWHTHELPEPDPTVVLMVSLDKHQLPTAPVIPGPPVQGDAEYGEPSGIGPSVQYTVETPPPIVRG